MTSLAALGAAVSCLLPAARAQAPIVINEFQYDDSSTDDVEFVELYNASFASIDIGGWTLEMKDAAIPDNNPDVVLPPGPLILLPGDFYVIGNAAVPNVDLVVATGMLENDNESITLLDTNGRVVDTLVYESNKGVWDASLVEGDDGIWGNHQGVQLPDASFTSWSRIRDGRDSGRNGFDFRNVQATPGASNDQPRTNYFDPFDALASGSEAPRWGGSFKRVRVVDPTVVDALNPNALPASPGGGNAAVFWDETGGGNTNMLLKDVSAEMLFEAWVWIASDTAGLAAGDREHWSIGFGTTGSLYNASDVTLDAYGAGGAPLVENGNTGLAWSYQRRQIDGRVALDFIYHNDGGWGTGAVSGPVVIGTVPIVAGVNDGWQRIRIQLTGGVAEGRFGGTYGSIQDGVAFATNFALDRAEYGVYTGYRERITDRTRERPLTLDDVLVNVCNDADIELLAACPDGFHGLGGPLLSFNGNPAPGDALDVIADNLYATAFTALLIGTELAPFLDLSLVGALPGAKLCVTPILVLPAGGTPSALFTFGIPASLSVCGTVLDFQWLDYDPTSPLPLPFASSTVGRVTIGV